MRASRGLSLVEMMVGTMLVFTAGTTLCMVVASTSHQIVRERAHSEALQAAQQETQLLTVSQGWQHYGIEGLSASPSPSPSMLPGTILSPASDLGCVQYADVDPGYFNLRWPGVNTLTATITFLVEQQPETLTLTTLSEGTTLRDVTCGPGWIAFIGPDGGVNLIAQGATTPPVGSSGSGPPQLQLLTGFTPVSNGAGPPINVVPAGLAVSSNGASIASTLANYSAYQITQGPFGQGTGWSTNNMGANGSPTGVAYDGSGNVWCVVTDKRCLYCANALHPVCVPAPGQDPLVLPVNIAWDQANSRLWVADQGNLCLRYYSPGGGWSGPLRAWGMGRPRGVTADLQGNVYTADAMNLWEYSGSLSGGAAGGCGQQGGGLTLVSPLPQLAPTPPPPIQLVVPSQAPLSPPPPIPLQHNVESLSYSASDKCIYLNATSNLDGWLYKWSPPSPGVPGAGVFTPVTYALPAPTPSP